MPTRRLTKVIALGVPWVKVNKYLRTLFILMSDPASKNDVSQMDWTFRGPIYKDSWLMDSSEFHDDLAEAITDTKVSGGKPPNPGGESSGDGLTKAQRKRARQEAEVKTKVPGKSQVQKVTDGKTFAWTPAGTDLKKGAGGKFLSMPGRSHAVLVEWNKKNGTTRKCWGHHNFEGGCPLTACKAPH